MRKPVILIIDDDAFYRETLADAFGAIGCSCYAAGDGNEGYRLYSKIVPDLVVLDRIMPNSGGTRCLMAVKENPNRRDAVLVVYSSTIKEKDDEEQDREVSHDGFSRVLSESKSTPPAELVEQLAQFVPAGE